MKKTAVFTWLLSVSIGGLTGCGGGDSGGGESGGTAGAASTQALGGSANGGTTVNGGGTPSGSTGGTTGVAVGGGSFTCSPWPVGKLFPALGPSFYGPDPGPCSSTQVSSQGTTLFAFEYVYSEAGVLLSLFDLDTGETYESYIRDEFDRIGSITSVYAGVEAVLDYGVDSVTLTKSETVERYQLDAAGYPISWTSKNLSDGSARMSAVYAYENCRLVSSTYADAAGVVLPLDGSVEIIYDDVGHMVSRRNGKGTVSTYDYSCW